MNNKTKIVLGLAAMVAGTVGVGTTATFAWFTVQNTASIVFNNAHVISESASITATYVKVDNNHLGSLSKDENGNDVWTADATGVTWAAQPANAGFSITGAQTQVTDISGDGKTFYKPNWLNGKSGIQASSIPTIANTAAKSVYVAFGIKLHNNGTSTTRVYLDNTCRLTYGSGAHDADAAKSTRIALWNSDYSKLVTYWQPYLQDDSQYKYLTAAATGTTAYSVDARSLAEANAIVDDPTALTANQHVKWILGQGTANGITGATGAFATTYASTDVTSGRFVAELGAQADFELRLTMWIEGTNKSATDNAIGGNVGLNLDLIAATI